MLLWPTSGRAGVTLPILYGWERRYYAAQRGSGRLLRYLRTRWVETNQRGSEYSSWLSPKFCPMEQSDSHGANLSGHSGHQCLRGSEFSSWLSPKFCPIEPERWRHTAVRPWDLLPTFTAQLTHSCPTWIATTQSNKCWAAKYRFWPNVHGRHGQGCGRDHEGHLRCCGGKGRRRTR